MLHSRGFGLVTAHLDRKTGLRSGWATTCSEYVTGTRYRPETVLDKLTIGVDSVSTAGLERRLRRPGVGKSKRGEYISFLDPFREDMPEEVSF
jgi:hypothetical protein